MMADTLALVDGKVFTSKDMMSAIDNVLIRLNDTGNINQAVKVLNDLDRIDNVTGHAKARLLYGMSIWYEQNKEDDFSNYVDSVSSTKKVTVERYVNVWQQIEDENIPKKIQSRPMRDLVPIAAMLSQGYEPTKEQWDEIHLASNSSDLSEIIRKVKGKKPRKSGLKIYLEKDGSLNMWKNNQKTYVGWLDVEEAKSSPDLEQAIKRIVDSAQIIRR